MTSTDRLRIAAYSSLKKESCYCNVCYVRKGILLLSFVQFNDSCVSLQINGYRWIGETICRRPYVRVYEVEKPLLLI